MTFAGAGGGASAKRYRNDSRTAEGTPSSSAGENSSWRPAATAAASKSGSPGGVGVALTT